MKNILYTIILFILVPFSIPSVHAICGDEDKFYTGLFPEYYYFNRSERKKFALELLKRTEELNAQLPRLSPKEKEWLHKELHSKDTMRSLRAINTQEYSVKEVALFFDEIINNITKISTDKIEIKKEMVAWSNLASTFLLLPEKKLVRLISDKVIEHPHYKDLEKKFPVRYKMLLEDSISHTCISNANVIITDILKRYIDGIDFENQNEVLLYEMNN